MTKKEHYEYMVSMLQAIKMDYVIEDIEWVDLINQRIKRYKRLSKNAEEDTDDETRI